MRPTAQGRLHLVDDRVSVLKSVAVRHQSVIRTTGLLDPGNRTLADVLDARHPLVVVTPEIDRLYGVTLRRYLSTHCPNGFDTLVLARTEETKTFSGVIEICEYAASIDLRRTSPIVAVGGGVCTDMVGTAAAVFRRGVPHVKVPTTLIGLVDAGIGTKNAVNHSGRKSMLGTFHPPEASLLDLGFVASLPDRHVVNGMAEIAKVAIVTDATLFTLLEAAGPTMVDTRLRAPATAVGTMVGRAVHGMLSQLADNVFEWDGFRRAMDFGHTFSPHLEVASHHGILHGEAVAMDMALSACIARTLGLLDEESTNRVLTLLRDLGLELAWSETDAEVLFQSLWSVHEHRGGHLNLCLPSGIGDHVFVDLPDLDVDVLRGAQRRLAAEQGCVEAREVVPTRESISR